MAKNITISWSDIKSITNEKLVTYNSRGHISINWIVIKTDDSQLAEIGGRNVLGKGPWQIKSTKKNIRVVRKFVNRFSKNVKMKI